jgi:hypothetical protein
LVNTIMMIYDPSLANRASGKPKCLAAKDASRLVE